MLIIEGLNTATRGDAFVVEYRYSMFGSQWVITTNPAPDTFGEPRRTNECRLLLNTRERSDAE